MHTDEVVARSPRRPTVSLNEWMDPVQPPQRIGRKAGRSVSDAVYAPILVDKREKHVHQMWDFVESRRDVVAHIDWLFAESTAELSYIRNGSVV